MSASSLVKPLRTARDLTVKVAKKHGIAIAATTAALAVLTYQAKHSEKEDLSAAEQNA